MEFIPLITVLIPTYKYDFLEQAITSVQEQNYENWECIIVNDASPYDIDSIVSKFTDHRIKYFKNIKNCGALNVVDNWNIALSYASGEFVICMGDDDMLMPNALQTYVELMKKYPHIDIFHGRTLIIDENNNIKSIQEPRPEYESIYSYIYYNILVGRRQFIGDYLFRTSVLKRIGGFISLPKGWISDELTCFSIAQKKGIVNTQNFIFKYRENSQTITSGIDVYTKLQNRRIKINWIYDLLSKNRFDKNIIESYYIESVLKKLDEWEYNLMKGEIWDDLKKQGLKKILNWKKFQYDIPSKIKIQELRMENIKRELTSKDICMLSAKYYLFKLKNLFEKI